MKKLNWLYFVVVALALSAGIARAQAAGGAVDTRTPDVLIKEVTTEVMNSVKSDPKLEAGDINAISALVNQKILPYTDFARTTQLVTGRNWRNATPAQQKELVVQFETLLIRTYAGAVAQIRDQQVQYLPFHSSPGDTDAVVRTRVVPTNQGSNPIELDYRLGKTASGWKVYDINILGLWLIQTYQQQFNEQITNSGIDGLIKFLTDRNQKLASGNK